MSPLYKFQLIDLLWKFVWLFFNFLHEKLNKLEIRLDNSMRLAEEKKRPNNTISDSQAIGKGGALFALFPLNHKLDFWREYHLEIPFKREFQTDRYTEFTFKLGVFLMIQ